MFGNWNGSYMMRLCVVNNVIVGKVGFGEVLGKLSGFFGVSFINDN